MSLGLFSLVLAERAVTAVREYANTRRLLAAKVPCVSSELQALQIRGNLGTFSAARDALETLMRVYLSRLRPTRHNRADWMGTRSHTVSVYPSRSEAKRVKRRSTAGTCA